jgi:hypothetical protein
MCCRTDRQQRRYVTTPIFRWRERCISGEWVGTGNILREDSCGSRWPLRLGLVTGQVPGDNF